MPCYKVRTHHRASSWGRIGECSKGGDQIQEIGKLRGNFLSMVLLESCPNRDSTAPVIWLNSTSLSPNSFLLSLTSASVSEHAHPFIVSRSAMFQSLLDLLPTALDQMCRPWKHSGGTTHNAG